MSSATTEIINAARQEAPKSPWAARMAIIADPSLKPGDATVSSGATSIDARISAGLARVQEVLAR